MTPNRLSGRDAAEIFVGGTTTSRADDRDEFHVFLDTLSYRASSEADNPAYQRFLTGRPHEPFS